LKVKRGAGGGEPPALAIFENLLLKLCILDMFQLKFSLKIENNISIGRRKRSPWLPTPLACSMVHTFVMMCSKSFLLIFSAQLLKSAKRQYSITSAHMEDLDLTMYDFATSYDRRLLVSLLVSRALASIILKIGATDGSQSAVTEMMAICNDAVRKRVYNLITRSQNAPILHTEEFSALPSCDLKNALILLYG